MEAGECAAGDGDEEDREEELAGSVGEADEGRSGHLALAVGTHDEDAEDSCDDHDDHHDGGEVVTRLLQGLDRHGGCEHEVCHGHSNPAVLVEIERKLHADSEHEDEQHDSADEFLPALEVELAAGPAEEDGDEGEEQGDGASSATVVGLGIVDSTAVSHGHLEGACNHGGEGSDDDEAEEPAEEQEQATAGLADVLLDELGKRLAVVLHGSIESAEVMDSAKEDATDEDPEHDRDPAECHGDDGARDRASAADGRELMGKNGKAGSGREVLSVLHAHCRSQSILVDAPLIR